MELGTMTKHTLDAGTLILPSGRYPELIFRNLKAETEEETPGADSDMPLRWEAVEPYKQPAHRNEVGLFAEGDTLTDFSAAIKAIGGGRRAAASIHHVLYDIEPVLSDAVVTPVSDLQDVDHVENVNASRRHIMPLCGPKELEACRELEKGFTEEMAKDEASRCLQCGLICYEQNWDEDAEQQEIRRSA